MNPLPSLACWQGTNDFGPHMFAITSIKHRPVTSTLGSPTSGSQVYMPTKNFQTWVGVHLGPKWDGLGENLSSIRYFCSPGVPLRLRCRLKPQVAGRAHETSGLTFQLPTTSALIFLQTAVGQHQYHFGVGAPPILVDLWGL